VPLGIALAVAVASGVFRRFSVAGPLRLPPDRGVWPVVVATLLGLGAWLGLQMGYGLYRAAQWHAAGNNAPFSTDQLTANDYAWLATVPAAIGFVLFLIADATAGRLARPLGYVPHRVAAGLGWGVVGGVIVLPTMMVGSSLLEWGYQQVGFEHPMEHDLLRVMTEAGPGAKLALVVGAAVAAPVFEEMLFRGHLQSVLVWLFAWLTRSKPAPPAFAVVVPPSGDVGDVQGSPAIPLPPPLPVAAAVTDDVPDPRRDARVRWAAIVVASVVFAFVHPLWTVPLIFLLSLGLGYAYERTGNLWVPIVMHAVFNGTQTLIFLLLQNGTLAR
ncbi:MAG TPA: CPBP family intramembrane glutamic endopeptidase, partial [Tepidisphaeraceae bacterium]|nr:CPBP family intramembrane glutamic endopeptidase [Tepidisphaeraceae bacterium]